MSTAKSSGLFTLRLFSDTGAEQDYQLLEALSNWQAPQDPQGNREWLQNRRQYDESRRARRHYIAVHGGTGEPVGYACLEQQGPDPKGFRLYLVFNPNQWAFSELGEFMYERLLSDARELGATTLAFVEYANDLPFLSYLRDHGFVPVGSASYNGFEIVRLEKRL